MSEPPRGHQNERSSLHSTYVVDQTVILGNVCKLWSYDTRGSSNTLTFLQLSSSLLHTPSYQSEHVVHGQQGLLSCSAHAFANSTYEKKR
jgi:hypothetical protein